MLVQERKPIEPKQPVIVRILVAVPHCPDHGRMFSRGPVRNAPSVTWYRCPVCGLIAKGSRRRVD